MDVRAKWWRLFYAGLYHLSDYPRHSGSYHGICDRQSRTDQSSHATQVEADDRDTIQTIKDIRDALKSAINDLIYALNIIADLYKYAPAGSYETVFNFGDITYNYEEDRANWWNYVIQGKIPAWKFFEKFEGMTREEYEELQKDLNKSETMFDDEE